MNRIAINGVDFLDRYGLYLQSKDITAGKVRENYVDIPGRNGKLDLTDIFGLTYDNGELKVTLVGVYPSAGEFWQVVGAIKNQFNGQKYLITVYDGTFEFRYTGRITVGSAERDGSVGTLEISAVTDVGGEAYQNVLLGVNIDSSMSYSFDLITGGGTPTQVNILASQSTSGTVNVTINDQTFNCEDSSVYQITSNFPLYVDGTSNLVQTSEDCVLTIGIGWEVQ